MQTVCQNNIPLLLWLIKSKIFLRVADGHIDLVTETKNINSKAPPSTPHSTRPHLLTRATGGRRGFWLKMNQRSEGGEALVLSEGDVGVVVHSEHLGCVVDGEASYVLNVRLQGWNQSVS